MALNKSKLWIVLIVVCLLCLLIAAPAVASERLTGDVVIIDEPMTDDVYAFADVIRVEAPIDGDLIAFGGQIIIDDNISGDVIAAAQSIEFNGNIGDDLRAGGTVIVFADDVNIEDDATLAAYAIEMESDTTVGGDLYFAAGQGKVGNVSGDLFADAIAIQIAGTVEGAAAVSVDNQPVVDPFQFTPNQDLPEFSMLPPGLSFTNGGRVEGNLFYEAPSELDIPGSVVGGDLDFEQSSDATQQSPASAALQAVGQYVGAFVTTLLVGLILINLTPNFVTGTLNTLRTRMIASFGMGLLSYVALILVFIFVFILVLILLGVSRTGISGPILRLLFLFSNVTLTTFGIITRWVAPVLAALLIGRRMYRGEDTLLALIIGLAVVLFVLSLPLIGRPILGSLLGILALGSVLLHVMTSRTSAQPTENGV